MTVAATDSRDSVQECQNGCLNQTGHPIHETIN